MSRILHQRKEITFKTKSDGKAQMKTWKFSICEKQKNNSIEFDQMIHHEMFTDNVVVNKERSCGK